VVCNSGCPERLTSGDGPSSYNASSSCTNGEAIGEATRVGGVAGTSPKLGRSGLSLSLHPLNRALVPSGRALVPLAR
jgi:hypothetical protein